MQLVPQLFSTNAPHVTGIPTPSSLVKAPIPGLFQAQLSTSIANFAPAVSQLFARKTVTVGATLPTVPTPSDPLEAKLAAQIATRLQNGESLDSIVAALSKSLATSVANGQGGAADALGQLQKVFAAALSPPGKAPPSADGNGALALAHRFRQLAELAATIAPQTGQPNRFLGPDLDAKAKVDLAPADTNQPSEAQAPGSLAVSVDSILNAAAVALGATLTPSVQAPLITPPANTNGPSASADAASVGSTPTGLGPIAVDASRVPAKPLTSAPVPSRQLGSGSARNTQLAPAIAPSVTVESLAAPIAALLANDGRTVASSDRKSGANGDTSLGRILTRAINVAPSLDSAPAQSSTTGGGNTQTGGNLDAFLTAFAAAVAKADDSAKNGLPTTISPATDFLATLDAANAASAATSQPVSPPPTIGIGIGNSNGPVPLAFDASLFGPAYTPQNADRYAVVEQVLKGLSIRNLGGISNSEVRLRLVPEHLGDVNVKLVITNGNVNATLVAANADVRDTLVANQSQLARSLDSAGLKLTGFNVDVSNGGFAGFPQQQQQQQPSAARGSVASTFDNSKSEDDLAIAATPSFAPPSVTDVALGHLNALV